MTTGDWLACELVWLGAATGVVTGLATDVLESTDPLWPVAAPENAVFPEDWRSLGLLSG